MTFKTLVSLEKRLTSKPMKLKDSEVNEYLKELELWIKKEAANGTDDKGTKRKTNKKLENKQSSK